MYIPAVNGRIGGIVDSEFREAKAPPHRANYDFGRLKKEAMLCFLLVLTCIGYDRPPVVMNITILK